MNYHEKPALGSSAINDIFSRTPAYFKAKYSDKEIKVEPTADMEFGTAFHTKILEPLNYSATVAVKPEGYDGRKTEWKEWKKDLEGKIILSAEQGEAIERMNIALLENKQAFELLSAMSGVEVELFWKDRIHGIDLKGKIDGVVENTDGTVSILDIKTAKTASPIGFQKIVADRGYHRQMAHYKEGFEATTGKRVSDAYLLAIEKTKPYLNAVYRLSATMLEAGLFERNHALDIYAKCVETNIWGGYENGVIELPRWYNHLTLED